MSIISPPLEIILLGGGGCDLDRDTLLGVFDLFFFRNDVGGPFLRSDLEHDIDFFL